jgi:hypothetical protein
MRIVRCLKPVLAAGMVITVSCREPRLDDGGNEVQACPLHGEALLKDEVIVTYGCLRDEIPPNLGGERDPSIARETEMEAELKRFPLHRSSVHSGESRSSNDPPRYAIVWYCQACRTARLKWYIDKLGGDEVAARKWLFGDFSKSSVK